MTNASLKEQLEAVVSQLSENIIKTQKVKAKGSPQTSFQGTRIPSSPRSRDSHEAKPANQSVQTKPKWLDQAQYGVELLKAYFPNCFKTLNEVKPLKKGIKEDLVKRLSTMSDVVIEDKACMVKSLTYYVNTLAYHKSVVEGAGRIDLEGVVTGTVSAEEATYSKEKQQAKLTARLSKRKEIKE